MKIVSCYKSVPDEETIKVKQDGTLDFSTADWKIGQYDLNAVEAGMQLVEMTGGEMVVLTAAAANLAENSKLRKAILSRGPSSMVAVSDDRLADADSYATAQVLKAAIKKIGDVDLIICGEGSGDIYSQQVGSVLGNLMSVPTVNAVSNIEFNNSKLIVERSIEDGTEVLEVNLPAVLCVTSDINTPRIAGMKDILSAGKKPATVWNLDDVKVNMLNACDKISILAPEQTDRKKIILEGNGDENIQTLYGHLRKLV